MKSRRALGILAQPALVLPVLLAAALLAVAFKLGDLGRVVGRVQAIPLWVLAFSLAMSAIYLVLKAFQLRLLLTNLGLDLDWRRLALAFSVGELAVTLPFGIFAQNWVLTRAGAARFGRSSAATVVMLLSETVVVLLFLAVNGIPRWPQVRPVAAVFAAGVVALVLGVLLFEKPTRRLAQRFRGPLVHRTLVEAFEMIHGMRRLSDPRVLAVNLVLAAAYLGALAFVFLAVGRAVGVHHLDYLSAATIYGFSLAVVLLCGGLVTQIGTVEVLGMGAAQAWGINLTDGLALMLGFRLVWTGSMWLLNLPVVFALWRSIKPRPEPRSDGVHDLKEAPD